MKKIILLFTGFCLAFCVGISQVVTDYDGNGYDTVVIGTTVWLRPNLKVTHFRNGIPIPNVTGALTWASLASGARCYYNNDSATYDSVYGPLYNWYAANDPNGICPAGWHVSTNAEWEAAESYLGGVYVAGGKMKEAGTLHWASPNYGATNSSGFTGLPGGARDPNTNTYRWKSENGFWWTSTVVNTSLAWSVYFYYQDTGADHNPTSMKYGFSIRCVQDETTGQENSHPAKEIKIYPNPATTAITIECPGQPAPRLIIYDPAGKMLLERTLNEDRNMIDISELAEGLYLLQLAGEQGTVWQKLVKK